MLQTSVSKIYWSILQLKQYDMFSKHCTIFTTRGMQKEQEKQEREVRLMLF